MRSMSLIMLAGVVFFACGGGVGAQRGLSTSQALTGTAELLEFETPGARQELFRDVIRQGQQQAGAPGAVLFPIHVNGQFVAAPAMELRADLLSSGDAGSPALLQFEDKGAEGFSEDRRDAYQGLSEREAAELVARSLIARWNLNVTSAVRVVRAPGEAYAAAYMDGVLRINPSFVYMAAAPTTP